VTTHTLSDAEVVVLTLSLGKVQKLFLLVEFDVVGGDEFLH
jgi:hypothetical protein